MSTQQREKKTVLGTESKPVEHNQTIGSYSSNEKRNTWRQKVKENTVDSRYMYLDFSYLE